MSNSHIPKILKNCIIFINFLYKYSVYFKIFFNTFILIVLLGREFDISFYLKEKPKLKDDSKSDKEEERSKSVLEQSSKSAQVLNFFPEINCLSKKFTEVESTDKLLKLIHLFDLQSFVLLTESSESGTPIFTETNVKLLLSSFCISAFNIRWLVS